MTSALRSQLKWSSTGIEINLLNKLNFLYPVVNAYNTWRMDRYLNPLFDSRYSAFQDKGTIPGKTVIDLALKAYLAENPSAKIIPDAFRETAIAQIKLFIFAGHDTTSSAVIFAYDLLYKHPEILEKVRNEHDTVLGTDMSSAAQLLISKPHLLNNLPYTVACIKESLRLYPTVAALRVGQPNFTLTGPSGQHFSTANCIILGDHYALHHNPTVWPDAESFLPERWLVDPSHALYPAPHAWRPFEKGPRNCVGMELAMTEIKIILALTVRGFEIRDAYAEFDRGRGRREGMGVQGRRTYMVRGTGGGHPADGYPCRVSMAKRDGRGE